MPIRVRAGRYISSGRDGTGWRGYCFSLLARLVWKAFLSGKGLGFVWNILVARGLEGCDGMLAYATPRVRVIMGWVGRTGAVGLKSGSGLSSGGEVVFWRVVRYGSLRVRKGQDGN